MKTKSRGLAARVHVRPQERIGEIPLDANLGRLRASGLTRGFDRNLLPAIDLLHIELWNAPLAHGKTNRRDAQLGRVLHDLLRFASLRQTVHPEDARALRQGS